MSLVFPAKRPSVSVGENPCEIRAAALKIVDFVLSENGSIENVYEATVHRPRRGRIWIASYTGPEGGQVWRSTGLTNQRQALLVARRWELEARAQRQRMERKVRSPMVRAGREIGLSQQEVALILNLSVRAVRMIERRAVSKLLRHPGLRQVWHDYLAGQLAEGQRRLAPEEINALFDLVRSKEERLALERLLRLILP